MPINFHREHLLTLPDAAALLPGKGGRGHMRYETVRKWIVEGRRGVRLESIRVGGTRFTSREAIDRFISRLNTDAPKERVRNPKPSVAEGLAAHGITD